MVSLSTSSLLGAISQPAKCNSALFALADLTSLEFQRTNVITHAIEITYFGSRFSVDQELL